MCENYKVMVKRDNGAVIEFARLRCKLWACSECAIANARQWRGHLLHTLNSEKFASSRWSFITITMEDWVHHISDFKRRVEVSIQEYQQKWNNFITRMKQLYGKFEYIRTIEMHDSGVMHIHLLASVEIGDVHKTEKLEYSPRLKKLLTDCGFGYISNVQNMGDWNVGRVVGYIVKYMTKEKREFHEIIHGKRVRRIQTSRGIGSPNLEKEEASGDWRVTTCITYEDYLRARGQDKKLYDLNKRREIDGDDFYDENEVFLGILK